MSDSNLSVPNEAGGNNKMTGGPPAVAEAKAPVRWVPTLYFAEGLPMITVSVVAAIMYKNLGISNDVIALHTGLLYLPWTIKPLWAPLLEMFKTKRHWVLWMEFGMAITLGTVALALPLPSYMPVTLAIFWVTGFMSSTQDIAADGLYISTMSPRQQSAWVGIQGICWNAGRIMASGILVRLTGMLYDSTGSWVTSWAMVMLTLGGIMGLLGLWHLKFLPQDQRTSDAPTNLGDGFATFLDTLVTFFQKPNVWLMIVFILLYRSGEGFLEKIGPLFLLDKPEVGGLGLSNQELGDINGIYGTIGFMLGALGGGVFASKFTLKRSIFWLCVALNVPNVTYVYLSYMHPESLTEITVWITIEKLGYGFGSVAHMLYMMQQVAPGKYKTAHYAFATSLMGLGLMVPSAISGYIQVAMGYQQFFVFVLIATIPSFVATYFAPFQDDLESPGGKKPDGGVANA